MKTHISLFTGIGGFDLACEWAGIETIAQVEIDPYCLKLLALRFPLAKRYTDIKQFNGTEYAYGTINPSTGTRKRRERVFLLTGGFP